MTHHTHTDTDNATVTDRDVTVFGMNEDQFRGLEPVLGLPKYYLGRFKAAPGEVRDILLTRDACGNDTGMDRAIVYVRRCGLAYEETRAVRYEPSSAVSYRLVDGDGVRCDIVTSLEAVGRFVALAVAEDCEYSVQLIDPTGWQYNEHSNQLGDWCPWSGKQIKPDADPYDDDEACPATCPDSEIEPAEVEGD